MRIDCGQEPGNERNSEYADDEGNKKAGILLPAFIYMVQVLYYFFSSGFTSVVTGAGVFAFLL